MGKMSVEELQNRILEDLGVLAQVDDTPVPEAVGRCLAENVHAPINVPVFTRSAVDGYAIKSRDTEIASREEPVMLDIIEKVTTGVVPRQRIQSGQATLVTTGAMLPRGADAVVLVENVSARGQQVIISDRVKKGEHVSVAGEDLGTGEAVLPKGHIVRLVDVAALSALGISRIPVVRRPKVAIFSTGDELVSPGHPLGPAQVYDANAYLLEAAVR
ncbi:MAG TPA: hypothetical protein DD856_10560, partial [Sulfobacillus sp.]|nr:hypothetical protein [Sulfobacillus sp.]